MVVGSVRALGMVLGGRQGALNGVGNHQGSSQRGRFWGVVVIGLGPSSW